MNAKQIIPPILALAALAQAGSAAAQGRGDACDDLVLRMSQMASIVYDPGDDAPRAVEVELSNDSPAQSLNCDLNSVVLSQTTPQPLAFVGEGEILQTQQVRDPNVAYRQQNFELSQTALRALEAGRALRFALVEPHTGQFVPPGRYVLPFTVSVNGAAATSAELAIDVIPRVLAIGKSRNVTTIDFGELETGETRQSVVLLKTNALLRVFAASDNGGELKHETYPDAPGVPYLAWLDDAPLDLTRGSVQDFSKGPGQGTHVGKLRIQIGDVTARWAGVYKDVLTLHFTAY